MFPSCPNKEITTRKKPVNVAWMDEKNHTCENGGTHLRIFFLAFTDELEKQILKKLLKWANKKIILIFTMLHFFKK